MLAMALCHSVVSALCHLLPFRKIGKSQWLVAHTSSRPSLMVVRYPWISHTGPLLHMPVLSGGTVDPLLFWVVHAWMFVVPCWYILVSICGLPVLCGPNPMLVHNTSSLPNLSRSRSISSASILDVLHVLFQHILLRSHWQQVTWD